MPPTLPAAKNLFLHWKLTVVDYIEPWIILCTDSCRMDVIFFPTKRTRLRRHHASRKTIDPCEFNFQVSSPDDVIGGGTLGPPLAIRAISRMRHCSTLST